MSVQGRRELTFLVLTATALGIIDSMIPRPVPFLKIGLANVASVVAVMRYGYLRTLELNIIRAFAVALITGVTATPTFVLSLSGAVASATVMAAVYRAFPGRISITGMSVAGSVSSLWAQLIAASFILYRLPLRNILPLLTLWGIVSGMVVGVMAQTALERLFKSGVLRGEQG